MTSKPAFAMLALLAACYVEPATTYAQGNLTPPGAPAPMMKSLDQIEPRTPISSTPYTISKPGSYYLTTNLTVSSGNAIIINANGVMLNLNGFTIRSIAPSANGYGIIFGTSPHHNITICNGFIEGGVTNNGSGTYSGSGFAYGIYLVNTENTLVQRVSVYGCLYYGIYLGLGESTVVESCTVHTVGSYGINASMIRTSSALDCGGTAIFGDQVADCRGESSDGSGIYANKTAHGCYGTSISGNGLYAMEVQNCYGYSFGSDYGLFGASAQNCYGYSSSYCGLYAGAIAIGCRGYSSSGTGLSAHIANSCQGQNSYGTSQSIIYKYNMP